MPMWSHGIGFPFVWINKWDLYFFSVCNHSCFENWTRTAFSIHVCNTSYNNNEGKLRSWQRDSDKLITDISLGYEYVSDTTGAKTFDENIYFFFAICHKIKLFCTYTNQRMNHRCQMWPECSCSNACTCACLYTRICTTSCISLHEKKTCLKKCHWCSFDQSW